MGAVGGAMRGLGCLVVIGVVLVVLLVLSTLGFVPIDSKVIAGSLGIVMLLVVLLFGVIIAGLFWLKRFITQIFGAVAANSSPAEIHLVPAPELTWRNTDDALPAQLQFKQAGFEDLGMYRIEEMPEIKLRAYLHRSLYFWGIVYEHEQVGVWSDVVARYLDRTSATFSNAPRGHEMDHRPGHDKHYHMGETVSALVGRCVKSSTGKPMIPATHVDFPSVFERAYADEMLWRNSRGGPTRDEVRRVANNMGDDVSTPQINLATKLQREQAVGEFEAAMKKRVRALKHYTDDQWERIEDRLLFVHDGMTMDAVEELVSDYLEIEGFSVPEGTSPMQVFALANETQPVPRQYRLLMEIEEPVATDVYLAPAEDSEADLDL